MEPRRTFAYPRVLLPSEIQLIEALGLTDKEYWEFIRINDEYNGKRSEAYALIPDIRNEPTTIIIVNLVVGLALTAVSALLAPKPRTPDQKKGPNPLETEDQTSRSRFAPQSSFDSLQQLAALGATIPLVYCAYRQNANLGGVRVNSSLLWSFMTTLGRSQQLRALLLFSHGTTGTPDWQGYAIGDLLINNYALGKAKLFFSTNGGRFKQVNPLDAPQTTYAYGEMPKLAGGDTRDPFAVQWGDDLQSYFSGARTPTTQTTFGTYAAMPNGMAYRVNYELVLNISSETNPQVQLDNNTKRDKVYNPFYRYGYIYGAAPGGATITQEENTTVTYILDGEQYSSENFLPWGTNDAQQAADDGRFEADSNLIVGETYMIGNGYGVCIKKENSPWDVGKQVKAEFKLTTRAKFDTTQPNFTFGPGDKLLVQRVAVATVSNNRACDRTDITIKSTVFRKINGFTNVNSEPDDATIREYEKEDSPITLGSMTLYNKRLSFFALQYRSIGETGWQSWKSLTGTTYFCVLGRTPEAAYNMLSIYHPQTKQYEYQLAPLAGNALVEAIGNEFYFLEAASNFSETTGFPTVNFVQGPFPPDGFQVTYTGQKRQLTDSMCSNGEWVVKGYSGPTVPPDFNLRYRDAIQDFRLFDEEELSNNSAPEHEIVSVNELLIPESTANYTDLAYAGIRLNSGAEWTSFSEVSAFFKEGIRVLPSPFTADPNEPSNFQSTNLLPEIAYDLLTNTDYGVGEMVGATQVDRNEMATAANFCLSNKFFWDGVIGEKVNLREWIFEMAGYNLLQFRIKGGRFSLYPDVPFNGSGINYGGSITPKELFTDGNMKDLQVSFLSPEERQVFKAVVLWRQDTVNGFSQTRTVVITLETDVNDFGEKTSRTSDQDPEEVFDMGGFCTSQEHAIIFAKYALKTRQLVDHGIKFQTTPQMAMGLEPGEYIQVASTVSHPNVRGGANRLNNGSIAADGTVIGLQLEDGGHLIQYWKPGTEGLREVTIAIEQGKVVDSTVHNTIFALSLRNNPQTRVYKVESLTYAEDGLVEIAGSFAPLTSSGSLETLNWSSADFRVETA